MATTERPMPLAWCDNVWCGEVYDVFEGWAGHCPSCVALVDEHVAGVHLTLIEVCPECRREPRHRGGSRHTLRRPA